jgi:SAM-dependent methyltransferase
MPETEPWALALFRRSVLKQRKLAEIVGLLGPTEGLRCLDLGSDNGVVSLLLRRRGGRWASADLTAESVASIRELVGSDVHQVDAERLPFPDAEFDRVVVVDMLEHVPDEAAFVAELFRITKPGGRLVVNTPHLKRTALRRLRHALGQTDEKHGHLRPGYSPEGLRSLGREVRPGSALHLLPAEADTGSMREAPGRGDSPWHGRTGRTAAPGCSALIGGLPFAGCSG